MIVKVLDHGSVELIESMGNDFSIVDSARVSVLGKSKGEEQDLRLLRYLYKNQHTSPFEMVQFKFRVKAPIVVIRQWQRHRTWSYNEMSGRYMKFDLEFYTPEVYRGQSANNKQASSNEIIVLPEYVLRKRDQIRKDISDLYDTMIALGVSKEMARLDIPVSTYSTFIARTDANNLLKFLRLRLRDDAQYETRLYALAILELSKMVIPHTIKMFLNDLTTGYEWMSQ
jgi:thymidylate synthase (FAD)